MKEKKNIILFGSILGMMAIGLLYANITGLRIYNSDKVVQDNERTSSGRIRTGSGFHHK
jgi:hypothetical protein